MAAVLDEIVSRLEKHGVDFQVLTHEAVRTSEEAARVRGTPLSSGAKALILKGEGRVFMLVIPADRKLSRKKVRSALGCKSFRFLNKDELSAVTGLEPGAVPPFGSLFGIPTYCDEALGENQRINFNAGLRTASIQMGFEDYVKVESPVMGDYSDPPDTRPILG